MRLALLDDILYLWMKALKAFDKRKTGIADFRPSEVKNILVVSSTAIGDTLLSTPAIRAVRKAYPKSRIIAHLNASNMELFAGNPYVDGVIPNYGGYRRFMETVREMRGYSFDLALIFHGNEPQATPICYLAGARFIMKLPNTSRFNFLLSNRTPLVGWDDMGHGIEGRLKTARLAGCRDDGVAMDLFLDDADDAGVSGFLKESGVAEGTVLIGFQPGASTISRRWFEDRFVELGRRLLAQSPSRRIILTGSASEARLCADIAGKIGPLALSAAGRLPIRQAASLIKRLDLLVTGDTGPMHIAIAVKTPVVALYAVADAKKTGPLYDLDRHVVIQKPRTCVPCVSKKCEYQRCMEAISVDEVYKAVAGILGRGKGRGQGGA